MSRAHHTAMRTTVTPSPSATTTQTCSLDQPAPATLRLRADTPVLSQETPREDERRVQWADDVVNNEGMGKKSSKVCCIYHKPRAVGESSDEDSSDSSSDEDSDSGDDGAARPANKKNDHHIHNHKHDHDGHCKDTGGPRRELAKATKKAPNAYERIPKKT